MFKHIARTAAATLLLLVALIVSACGSEPQAGVVEVWSTWATMPDETAALFDRFGQETGIELRVRTGLKGSKIADRLAESPPPDLLLLSTGDPVASLVDEGLVAPLSGQPALAAVELDDIYPAALAQCTGGDGQLLCLPWGADVQLLYWNKALFQAAGLNPDRPPATMKELFEITIALTRRDQAGKLAQVGFIPDLPGSHSELFAGLLAEGQAGPAPVADMPSLQRALAWQQRFFDFYDPGQLEEFVATFTPHRTSAHPVFAGARLGCQECHRANALQKKNASAAGFLGGQVAMMVDGGWLASPAVAGQLAIDLGVAPFPAAAAAPDAANTTFVRGPVLAIPAKAVDAQAAGQLLAWLASPAILAEASFHNGLLPSSVAAAREPFFHQSAAQEMLLGLLASPDARHHPADPKWPARNARLADLEDVVFHTGQDPAAMISQLQGSLK